MRREPQPAELDAIREARPFAGFLEIAEIERFPIGKSGEGFKVRDRQDRAFKLRVCKSVEKAERLAAMIRHLPEVFPTFHGQDRSFLLTSYVAAQTPVAAGDRGFGRYLEGFSFEIGRLQAVAHRSAWSGRQEDMDHSFADSLDQIAKTGLLSAREAAAAVRLYERLRRDLDFEFHLDLGDSGPRNFIRSSERLYYVDEAGLVVIRGLGLSRLSMRSHEIVGAETGARGLMRSVRRGYESEGAEFPSRERLRLLSLYDLIVHQLLRGVREDRVLDRDLRDLRALLAPAADRPRSGSSPSGEPRRPPSGRPRVCLSTVEYPPTIGGVAMSARRLVRYLVEAGYEVEVFTLSEPEQPGEAAREEAGATVHRLPHQVNVLLAGLFLHEAIRRVDREAPFDLFHGFFLPLAYPCLEIAKQGDRPVIASIRGDDAVSWLGDPVRQQIVEAVLQEATWITSVTSDLLANVAGLAEISGRSSLILNAVDGEELPRWRRTEANRGVVGTLGKFREKKDIPLLVEAYAGIEPALRRRLLLAGFFNEPALQEEVERSIRQRELSAEVELTGPLAQEEVAGRLLAMDVFVQSSRHEGLPNALLEAAAVGVPVVSTNVGGARDILADGESALLVEPGDPRRLTAAVAAVLADDELARRLSRDALRVVETLRPSREKEEWTSLYARLLEGRAAAAR